MAHWSFLRRSLHDELDDELSWNDFLIPLVTGIVVAGAVHALLRHDDWPIAAVALMVTVQNVRHFRARRARLSGKSKANAAAAGSEDGGC